MNRSTKYHQRKSFYGGLLKLIKSLVKKIQLKKSDAPGFITFNYDVLCIGLNKFPIEPEHVDCYSLNMKAIFQWFKYTSKYITQSLEAETKTRTTTQSQSNDQSQ